MTDQLESCRGQRRGAFSDYAFAPPEARDRWPPERTFQLLHLRLDIAIDDDAKTVSGTATHRLAAINDGLREVALDQEGLDVRGVKDEDGKALDFELVGDQLIIQLPRARKAGDPFGLRIRYTCSPRKGLFFTGPDKGYPDKPRIVWSQGEEMDNRCWYPSYDYPNQKFTTEVVVTVRERYKALSNGHLVSETHDAAKRTRTFHWLQDKPHPNYLVALVVGEWDTKEWDADGVSVQAYVPKGMGKYIDLCFSRVPKMVQFFGKVTGLKFPWDKYAQACVPDFTFGGMENTSLTVLYEHCLTDEHAYPDYSSDALLSHELAHQWFGDWVTCKSWGHIWLNESFADYFECLWWEEHYGPDDFLLHLEDIRQQYYDEAEKEYKRPIVTHKFVDAEDMIDYHSYSKGCSVLHMLRTVLGDELWWKGIRHYVQKHGLQNVETTDFRVALEEATGKSLSWFFEEWLFSAGHPEYEVSWSWDETAKQVELRVKQTHEVKDQVPLFSMPVTLELADDDRVRRETVQVEKAEQTFRIAAARRPKTVLFDPDGAFLKKVTFNKPKDELLWQVAHAKSAWARIEACQGLGRFVGDVAVVAPLEKVLTKDKFWGVRRAAARALGDVGTPQARDVLLGSLQGQDSRVRLGIYEGLGKFRKDDGAFKALVKGYMEDGTYLPMATAADAIAATRHPGAFEAIVKGMDRYSQLERISRHAADALAKLRDERGLEALLERTRYGLPEFRRYGAAVGLGKLGYYFEKQHDEVMEELVALAYDANYRTKLGAVEGLTDLDYTKAIDELEKIADTASLGTVKRNARHGVLILRGKNAARAKRLEQQNELDALKDENKELKKRVAAVEAKLDARSRRRR